ncbi:putative Polynucleotidyl transferase [Tripterygium wilfordii]|uniref:Putative Polynucleotidyl transferase n=1 Tax=Tripterygium wilfordii TaxID=458696 RepID=A0A7J7D5B2_TRIWF|nr:Werner Syndrome-like exonuclease [Tripterygium wilfordii]KAF5741512.1 putative Polynucleotidyl transferase [Tripterygium wilfordii]
MSFAGKYIEITVTANSSVIDSWVSIIRSMHIGQQVVVGLVCEWRPNTTILMNNKTATLQLCIDTKCLIIQLFYLDRIPQSLKSFLTDPNFTFVGVEVARDVEKLRLEYGLNCASISDVRELTMVRWPTMFYRKPGLKDIARLVVGLEMPKPIHVTRSDWQDRVLDLVQIEYVAIDAYASYKIGHRLLKEK